MGHLIWRETQSGKRIKDRDLLRILRVKHLSDEHKNLLKRKKRRMKEIKRRQEEIRQEGDKLKEELACIEGENEIDIVEDSS